MQPTDIRINSLTAGSVIVQFRLQPEVLTNVAGLAARYQQMVATEDEALFGPVHARHNVTGKIDS